MNKDSELKTRIAAFLVLLAALLVVFAGFLGFFRDYGNIFRQGEEKTADVPQDIVVKWQNAVENGDMKNAFIYASQIVPRLRFSAPECRLYVSSLLRATALRSDFALDAR